MIGDTVGTADESGEIRSKKTQEWSETPGPVEQEVISDSEGVLRVINRSRTCPEMCDRQVICCTRSKMERSDRKLSRNAEVQDMSILKSPVITRFSRFEMANRKSENSERKIDGRDEGGL